MSIKLNRRTIEAVISALSAIVCACLCGCRLALAKMTVEDFSVEILTTNEMFHVEH